MVISEIKQLFHETLGSLFPSEEIGSFFTMLAAHYLGYSRLETAMNAAEVLSEDHIAQFIDALERLKTQEPIQYIIGVAHFYGLDFQVNPSTLIPRPETEELVEWIIADTSIDSVNSFSILDIGTGTGCIAITLAKNMSNAEVSAIDISEETLKTAKNNAKNHQVEVDFFIEDILVAQSLPKQFKVIVSNPPYVRESEKEAMQENVLRFEPSTALYVSDKDPLVFYRAIARLSMLYLEEDGALYLEINEYLSEEMHALLLEEGFASVELKNDLFGRPRMIKAKH